ncbi:MAG: glycosyltransferase [Verrucomicrobiota bacterium]
MNCSSLHIIDCINAKVGGPAQSVLTLVKELNRFQGNHQINSLDYSSWGEKPDEDCVSTVRSPFLAEFNGGMSPAFKRRIYQSAEKCNLIHNHGCWLAANRYARHASHCHKIPLLISPRGMLEPWAMKFGTIKKKIAWALFEFKNLSSARAFHATSKNEAASIRSLGFTQRIYLIPNGVHIPNLIRELPSKNLDISTDRPFFLFLSRIHQKKGIDILMNSWSQLRSHFPDWTAVIAGSEEDDSWSQALQNHPWITDSEQVLRLPFTSGDAKQWLLQNAAFSVLPSRSENFGNSIAESLAHATPVLTSTETPWQEITPRRCGWVTDLKNWDAAFQQSLSTPVPSLRTMGQRGRLWMENDFSWPCIADSMYSTYLHLTGMGPKPDCALDL